jgi:tripartite-type tricarboxylate transporter receptor subunit TctC
MGKWIGVALLAFAATCHAQAEWPGKPARIVVPFAPGGTTDILARIVANELTIAYKQTFVVDNKGGAGGNLGAAEVAASVPDGHTLLMGTPGTQSINQFLYGKMPYNTERDFAPVSFVAKVPNVLLVHPSLNVKTLQELIDLARAKPDFLNYGSPGNGTTGHLSTELLKSMAKIEATHIPFRGAGPALQALLGGQVQMAIDNLPSAIPHIRAGKLVALGVTSPGPVAALPGVPPIAATLPGYEAESWFVLMAPAATPPAVVRKLSATLDEILKRPDMAARLRDLGADPVGGTPEALGAFIAKETAKWKEVVKLSGAKVD